MKESDLTLAQENLGTGLVQVKALIEEQGGFITIESSELGGTAVTVGLLVTNFSDFDDNFMNSIPERVSDRILADNAMPIIL